MDFSDNKHSLAELVFQGATELESMQDFGEDAKNALMAWRHRPDSLSLPFINPEDIFKQLGERIHGAARQLA